jgi:hypothetical protein
MSEESTLESAGEVPAVLVIPPFNAPMAVKSSSAERSPDSHQENYQKFAAQLAASHSDAHARIGYPVHWLLGKPTKK